MAGTFVKTTLALSVSLACSAVAQAAYLGQLKVQSAPAQNFSATVQVHDVNASTKSLLAKLAPKTTYDQYQVVMPQSAQGLSMALVSKNPLTLKVSGKRPAQEQAFPLLLELHEGDQVTVRQYNIRIGAMGSVEPVAPMTKVAVATSVEAPKVVAATKPAVAKSVKAEKTMTPLERMKAKGYDLSKPITIEEGYTPWSLGMLYQSRYPGASVNQVLVALAVHNAEAFPNGNVRQLKTGAKVSAPPASLVQSINRQTAHEIVQKGLNIEEAAQRPMPIAKPQPVKKPIKQEAKPVEKVAVEPVKAEPVASVVEAKPAVVEPVEASAEPVKTDVASEPQPVQSTPVTVPEPAPVAPAVQETVPETLEIMTEEEKVVEQEESSSWYWWLLLVILLGAGGFVFWRTKQGKKVDFESLKKAMQEKGAPRQEPTVRRPIESSVVTSATTVEKKSEGTSAPVASVSAAVAPTQVVKSESVKAPEVVKPVPVAKPSASDDAFNVFDLVSDEPVAPATKPAPVAQPNAVAAPKVEQSMNDTLEMARSFIAINSKNDAVMLLQEVLQSGTPAERQTAQMLLDQIRQQS